MTSPAETLSPFFFFHATSVPSVMVSLNLGIWISGIVVIDQALKSKTVPSLYRFIALTLLTHNKLSSPQRSAFRHSAAQHARVVHCTASAHLPEKRAQSGHRAHRKYFSGCDNKLPPPLHKMVGPVPQSPPDAFSRLNHKSRVHRAV